MEKANKDNIEAMLLKINSFNSTPEFGTTRILFTKPEIANRNYVKDEMRGLGLDVAEDSIGNIYATLKGSDESLAPVWTGSHIDTVPNAGIFDGMAGVVCGLEALRMIKESGLEHKRGITTVVYTSEEPTRYGLGCIGSRAMAGELTLEGTKNLFDRGGKSLYDKLVELGYDTDKFGDIVKKKGEVYANVELHIEQNNRLEKAKKPIGIVKKICAPSNYIVTVKGCQSHAGGTSMEDRRDAYAAACEMGVVLEDLAKKCKSEYNTATIGMIDVIPYASNVIPGEAKFSVDLRDCNMDTKQALIKDFKKAFEDIANRRGVELIIEEENNDEPLTCNETVINTVKNACRTVNAESMDMISGPFHDTLFTGRFAPSAMIFVPSKNGISHSPDEWTEFSELALGTEVLARALLELSNMTKEL